MSALTIDISKLPAKGSPASNDYLHVRSGQSDYKTSVEGLRNSILGASTPPSSWEGVTDGSATLVATQLPTDSESAYLVFVDNTVYAPSEFTVDVSANTITLDVAPSTGLDYKIFSLIANKEFTSTVDDITVSAGQTLINLSNIVYTQGVNSLLVVINGAVTREYVETSTTSITLNVPLSGTEDLWVLHSSVLSTIVGSASDTTTVDVTGNTNVQERLDRSGVHSFHNLVDSASTIFTGLSLGVELDFTYYNSTQIINSGSKWQVIDLNAAATANGIGDDGYLYVNVSGGFGVKCKIVGEVITPSKFGADITGAVDATSFIYKLFNAGSDAVYGDIGATYTVTSKITPNAEQCFNMRGACLKVAAGTSFNVADPVVGLDNAGSKVINFEVDGNKSNVSHIPSGGVGLAGAVIRASRTAIKHGYIHDCKTNGAFTYKSGVEDVDFFDLRIEDNDWTGFGNEIPMLGNVNAKDVRYKSIRSSGNLLGGLYLAGGEDFTLDDVKTNDGNKNYFYIGDAVGGLINCRVSNSTLGTSNNAVSVVEIQGEVQTGASTGVKAACEVSFSNVVITGSGGGSALVVDGGADLKYSNLEISDANLGAVFTEGAVKGSRLTVNRVTSGGVTTSIPVVLKDTVIKNYGPTSGFQAGVFLATGSDNTILDGLEVGAESGETGEHGVWGVAGLTGVEIKRFKKFTGSGGKLNFSSTDMKTWNIDECNTDKDTLQLGAWNGKSLFLGSGFMWIDSSGDVRVKGGISEPLSDTDGVIVGTQT